MAVTKQGYLIAMRIIARGHAPAVLVSLARGMLAFASANAVGGGVRAPAHAGLPCFGNWRAALDDAPPIFDNRKRVFDVGY